MTDSFEIDDYEVQIQPYNWGDAIYQIHLDGPMRSDGTQHGAALNFVPEEPDEVGEVELYAEYSEVPGGNQVTAYVHVDFFDRIYRVLQTEDPLTFYYSHGGMWHEGSADDDDDEYDLWSFQIYSGEEPIGEGLRDEPPG